MQLAEAFVPVFRVNDPPHRVKRRASSGGERRDDIGFALLEAGLDEHSRPVVHDFFPVFGWHPSDTPGPVRIADKAEQGADCRRGPLLALSLRGGHFGSRGNERDCLLYSHRNDRVRLVLPEQNFLHTQERGKQHVSPEVHFALTDWGSVSLALRTSQGPKRGSGPWLRFFFSFPGGLSRPLPVARSAGCRLRL